MAEYDYKEYARQMRENAVKDFNGIILCSPELWEQIASIIENIPTAGVGEAVRCFECKHLIVHNITTLYASCLRCHFRFDPFQLDTRTHFCSLGERKE